MQSKNILDVKSFMYDKISCFADCGSECLIMRVPYDIAATMMKNMPESDAKNQLIERARVASRRSKILKSALDEIFEKK
ncbi:hypothetical protein MITSMUL_03135 [Mitsuokella multacida DSM 20544]|uniref:Uncharacterized protein n=2 Tax=Mitsuokella multacida TaxID=52226 RepID=C9KJD8_9FIRM|nr:hypothetical protein MITSMUL_03135 [Mitsuokella multacida DSM 20544]